MNLKEIKLTKKQIIIVIISLIVFYVVLFFLINFLRIKNKQMVFRAHDIDSFAGCFGEGKESYPSYEKMTEQEIEESLKKLDITREEFEEIKNECIKQSQISSFAGCKKSKHKWRIWSEMNEQEFNSALKYFNIDKKFFDYMKDGCKNGNWE